MGITALTDSQQAIFTSGTMLLRCQPQGRGHLSAIGKLLRITYSGNQCRRDHRPNTAKLLQSLCHRVALSDPNGLCQLLAEILNNLEDVLLHFETRDESLAVAHQDLRVDLYTATAQQIYPGRQPHQRAYAIR